MNARRVAGVTLGTGVGSAFMVDGRALSDGDGVPNGGYVWNIPWEGGIVEDLISTRGIQNLYRKRTGQTMTVRDIAMRARTEADAKDTMEEFGALLGTVLKCVCSPFAPDTIVIGGAISRSADLFLPAATAAMSGMRCRMEVSELLDDAALVGAAVAWSNATANGTGSCLSAK